MTWLQHWGMAFDPFRPGSGPFVATPGHEEAVSRLVHLVGSGERRAEIRGEAGIGKSIVLAEALRRLRRPDRRVCRIDQPADGSCVLRGVLGTLGHRPGAGVGRSELIGLLLDSARLARAQRTHLVLAVDDDGLLDSAEDHRLLDRILAVGRQGNGPFSVLVVGRGAATGREGWSLAIRIDRLTRRESEGYLSEKLRAAGRDRPTFDERALLRLHAISGGVPGAIDRLAGLSLRAGAIGADTLVSGSMVEGVALETVDRPDPVPSRC